MHPLIEALRQRQEGSYGKYAKRLEVSKSHLFPVLEKNRPAGRKLLSAVAYHFPELGPLILLYLRDRHNEESDEKEAG